MAERKSSRSKQRQLGQFMTPMPLAARMVESVSLSSDSRVLEPSFGDGSFLIPLLRGLISLHLGSPSERLAKVLTQNLWGVEIDPSLYRSTIERIEAEFGPLPSKHNLVLGDFFATEFMAQSFDVIAGNPPFGGTFDPILEDVLDRRYGRWDGHKLKKETYSFFIARCLDLLAPDGQLHFVSSDTFLTIKTMSGLRRKLMDLCAVRVETLPSFSEQTVQPTLILHACRSGRSEALLVNESVVARDLVESTGNFSWGISPEYAHFFDGPTLGDYVVATSGMTIGKNDLFLREIDEGQILEPYTFSFVDEPITVAREVQRARLNRLSPKLEAKYRQMELAGATRRNLVTQELDSPLRINLPHPDYRYYNKASSMIVYEPARWAVFWKDDGDAVLTFKKNGNWYLHGVGGQKYFEREGLTWQLVSASLNMRYLPPGFILDSGAPCAFLREGVEDDELLLILGWTLTEMATDILKTVINHTRNIQSKDVERLPYPHWVASELRREIVGLVRCMVEEATQGRQFRRTDPDLVKLEGMFAHPGQRRHVADA